MLINSARDVAGFNNKTHLQSLAEFAASIGENSRVLEIGVGFGGSTWQLLDSLPNNCELHSCDTFQMNNNKRKHIDGILQTHQTNVAIINQMAVYENKDQRAAFDWAVKQHPRYKTLMKRVHHYTSLKLLRNDVNWDMVYIDGLHSYENVSQELKKLDHVEYMCGDDYHPSHKGCKRAIDEWISRTGRPFAHDPFESNSGFWYSKKK